MDDSICSTDNFKPFVFVLMPFDEKFDDIYKFGIKGAAEDAKAHAERVDEQIFAEGILERIFGQIEKADVIVADMTGRNANVFYEVGYAHARDRIVILLTQNAEDIPLDLRHRQHIVYRGKIETLREELQRKLIWAIDESRKRSSKRYTISILGTQIPSSLSMQEIPIIEGEVASRTFKLPVLIKNNSIEPSPAITRICLFTSPRSNLVPIEYSLAQPGLTLWSYNIPVRLESIDVPVVDDSDDLTVMFLLNPTIGILPPGAVDRFHIDLMFKEKSTGEDNLFKIRIYTPSNYYDYPFRLKLRFEEEKEDSIWTTFTYSQS